MMYHLKFGPIVLWQLVYCTVSIKPQSFLPSYQQRSDTSVFQYWDSSNLNLYDLYYIVLSAMVQRK